MLSNIDMIQATQKRNGRQAESPGIHSLEKPKLVFNVFHEYQGCHFDGLSFIWWFHNLLFNSYSLLNDKKAPFNHVNMCLIEMNQNFTFPITWMYA